MRRIGLFLMAGLATACATTAKPVVDGPGASTAFAAKARAALSAQDWELADLHSKTKTLPAAKRSAVLPTLARARASHDAAVRSYYELHFADAALLPARLQDSEAALARSDADFRAARSLF
jgi:hypothetical protein